MGLGVSRSEQGEVKKRADRGDAAAPRGEMKRMEPRRDTDSYSMARLERVVAQLVDGQDALLARIDLLRNALKQRDQRVADLEAQVHANEEKRVAALSGLDSLIGQLDELEGRAESAAVSGADVQ